jgi:hypothetical protein
MENLKVKIDAKDFEDFAKHCKESPKVTMYYFQRAINATLPEVHFNIRERTPVITGRLKGGIEIKKEATMESLSGIIASTVFYGPFVHKRKPFMILGLKDSKREVVERFEEALRNIKEHLSKY